MTPRVPLLAALVLAATSYAPTTASAVQSGGAPPRAQTATIPPERVRCDSVVTTADLPMLPEASGLALARQGTPRLFALNDSGAPELVVLSPRGAALGTVVVSGAQVVDWEDVSSAACGDGSCLIVGDIGDNARQRDRITVYRVPEPREGDRMVRAERYEGEYPDGPHDAEALFVGPRGQLFILTKQGRGARLYAWPVRLTSGVNRLTFVAELRLDGGGGGRRFARITDAESSPDGREVAVRSNDTLFLFPMTSIVAGQTTGVREISLRHLREPQGEGVAPGRDGQLFLVGEGGGKGRPGTFASLACPQSGAAR